MRSGQLEPPRKSSSERPLVSGVARAKRLGKQQAACCHARRPRPHKAVAAMKIRARMDRHSGRSRAVHRAIPPAALSSR